ncbi:MAG TPA: RodZ domain-containing protein [Candidatus Sulfotelmatobacter sp.]|nr:RodZ domain-containing protein [Candidatus Sulfotelmatobacter sp.]
MGEFGNKFRQAREKKNLSLDDVSNVTKIGARMLQAIEEEHFDQLPGGVFNRGFVRAYAKHLGLNDEEAVTDYLACLRQAQIDAQQVWDTVRPDPVRPSSASNKLHAAESRKPTAKAQQSVQVEELPELQLPRVEDVRPPRQNFGSKSERGVPLKIIAAAIAVVVLAVLLWTRHSRSTDAAKPSTAPVTASSTMPAVTPAVISAVSTHPSPAAKSALPQQPAPKSAQVPVTGTPTPTASKTLATRESSDVTTRSFAPSTTKPVQKVAPSLTLVIRASENSWISVQADGQLITQETLIAPAATSFHASRELVVRVGNAAGINFLWNGEELPVQGAESEAKTFVFDAQGMRAPASDQTPH